MRKFVIFGLFVLAFAAIFGASHYFGQVGTERPLLIGVVPDYPPFFLTDQSRDPMGFDVDVVNNLAQRMGKTPKFVEMPLAALVLALSKNKIDAIVSGFEATDERKKKMRLIDYYSTQSKFIPLIFWKRADSAVNSIGDLKKQSLPIAIEAGSAQQQMCQELGISNIKEFSSYLDMIMELKRGSCCASIFDPNVVGHYMDKTPDLQLVKIPLEGSFSYPGVSIGVRKDDLKTGDEIAQHIQDMQKSGLINGYADKWKMDF